MLGEDIGGFIIDFSGALCGIIAIKIIIPHVDFAKIMFVLKSEI
jgi:hypothetical protein